MPVTLFAPVLDLMVRIIKSYGLDPKPLMRDAAIDPKLLSDHNARFRFSKVAAFHSKAMEVIPDPNFGLRAARFWHPSQMGALGYAWMTSDTLRSAFTRLARFSHVVSGAVDLELDESGDQLSLSFSFIEGPEVPASRIDTTMALLMAMVRSNAGDAFNPQSITFAHPAPEDTGPFYSLFRCPVAFDAPANSFTISAADADQARACSNAQLALLHDQLLIQYLAKLDKDNIVERVKVAIIDELASGNTSDESVARLLYMTERTLQRRLQEQGTTFKMLLNEVRHDLADKYIRDSSLSLNEISFLLGFSELSSFSRAFKRWTGQSPSDYRRSN